MAKQFEELGFKVRTTHFQITVYGLKDFMEKHDNKNESIKEAYINFEGYDFKGIVNPETGDIIYSTVTPKYRTVINANKKLNIRDSKLDTRESEIVQKAKQILNKNESIKETNIDEDLTILRETLKRIKDMEINEGMWASPFTIENAKQVAELLSKPITYEELNSEEGKQKVWNIIGDDEFWDNVDDEAFDNPAEDATSLILSREASSFIFIFSDSFSFFCSSILSFNFSTSKLLSDN